MTRTLQLVGEPEADKLLTESPLALLLGMLLDQQVAMEVAFNGPKKIADRIGGLDVVKIAEYDPEKIHHFRLTRDAVVAKFHRYAAPTLGSRAELFVDFFLNGNPAVPARKCFTLAG